tara:strand:+ start:1568 stop:4477 length:2910 start_codon:yes stop_codon:yes gene_type:complete
MTNKNQSSLDLIFKDSDLIQVRTGERVARPDEYPSMVFRVKSGTLRLLFNSCEKRGVQTLQKIDKGILIGSSNFIYGEPCEWVTACSDVILEAVSAKSFSELIWNDPNLLKDIITQNHSHIKANAVAKWLANLSKPISSPDSFIKNILPKSHLISIDDLQIDKYYKEDFVLIGANLSSGSIGRQLDYNKLSRLQKKDYKSPPLVLAIPITLLKNLMPSIGAQKTSFPSLEDINSSLKATDVPDAYSLGIRDDSNSKLSDEFPERFGIGNFGSQLAVYEMTAKLFKVPFRRDSVKKKIESYEVTGKKISTQLMAKYCTFMGLEARPVSIKASEIKKVTPPLLIEQGQKPVLIHAFRGNYYISGDGIKPLQKKPIKDLIAEKDIINFVSIKKSLVTAKDRFNWKWVWSIVRKYRGSLLLVVVISLTAQLFALGVPLLLQQLIDKVLTQGNVSSLNALAGLMITFALFQSILTSLRMFLFVDTTDRIDLTLGSSIIDRLLKLPLSFFERRPVGELSQRIGEMNNIRQFLTGTAITTFLDLVFSSIYLVVMLSYSPGLTAVALSTFPFYLGITFFAAPIYRQQLRARAVAQAETQAHLIESLSGIQTIKAQHGELRARWKWQKRYQRFVEQGYKSVVLGTTTGQIGSFLNTLSSLLILWFGLNMVLQGEFTLGQLLAFRIFANYVTAPLLRISNLWQGLQKVNLSMERLSDIVNEQTEAGEFDDEQIALAPVNGSVTIEDLNFGFQINSTLQLIDVNLKVEPGEFIGVVGLSGSGKSTLMKLIARLYNPNSGKILIDDTDISKVQLSSLRSQIGLVPQDGVLFEGSISENIALNDPNIDNEKIIQAAKMACAHEFIMELPQGYATRVAEKGANFSGGQRQRLAIARMIIESPSLLIMDEATSALDADTEKKVSRNLMEVMNQKTVFFVTHRMATIMKADRVVVMDKGRVAEFDTPEELIKQGGIFSALWNQQR